VSRPPRLARWLLDRALPPDVRAGVVGDLDEEYRTHVRPSRGRIRAAAWYWRQAIGSLPAARRLARRRRAAGAGAGTRGSSPAVWLGQAALDLRFGARLLIRQPGFTAAAVVTLALGIGANTAIFSLVQAVLLRPLPYDAPDRLVHLYELDTTTGETRGASWGEYRDWRRLSRTLEELAGYNGGSVTLTGEGTPDRVTVAQVTGGFFRLLGVDALLGRTIGEGEDGPNAAPVVVLTHRAWQRRFGGDPTVLGRRLTLNGRDTTIVGVLPSSFEFSLRGTAELYLPLAVSEAQVERRYWHWLDLIGRLGPGVTLEQARADLDALGRAAAPDIGEWHAAATETARPLRDEMVQGVRPALLVLAGAVGVVLLVTCANVAGLLVARSAARRRELGIRAAIGAGRSRLARQLLTEGLLLSAIGGAAGLVAGHWGLQALVAAMPERQRLAVPFLREVSLDQTMLAAAAGLTLVAGLLVGLAPSWRAMRGNLHDALKDGGRGASAGRGRTRPALVAAEVALAVVLVAGAGLLGRSLVGLLHVSPGFETSGLLTFRVSAPGTRYGTAETVQAFHDRLLERLRALPGAVGAATIDQLPLTGRGNTGVFSIEGRPTAPSDLAPEVNIRAVSAGYFDTMGIPLVGGRALTERDAAGAPNVVLVNQTLAARFFPDGALGERIVFSFFDGQPPWEIVGVVGDERFAALDEPVTPVVYFPYRQDPGGAFSVVVRSAVAPASLVAAARRELAAIDPEVPLYAAMSMDAIVAGSEPVFLRRFVLQLVGAFAALAVLLAAVGLYGVLAQAVVERTREIGVRIALGAARRDVVWLIVRRGMAPALTGLGVGLAAAAAASRLLGALLYGVRPGDPLTLGAVTALVATVALAACWLPARRATRVDPIEALRSE